MTARFKTGVTVVAAAAALGAGIGVSSLASAADPTTSPSPTPTAGGTAAPGDHQRGPGGHRGGPGHGPWDATLAKELAAKLGVTEAKVTEALKAVREANKPTAKPSAGATPSAGQTRPDPSARDAELAKALADQLGLDEAKVKTALDEIRAAHQADRAAALKTKLDAAVKAGTLTQAEADAVQKAVDKGVINVGPR